MLSEQLLGQKAKSCSCCKFEIKTGSAGTAVQVASVERETIIVLGQKTCVRTGKLSKNVLSFCMGGRVGQREYL